MMKLTINANIMLAVTIAIILLIVIITIIAIVYRKKDQKEVDKLLEDLRHDRKEKEVIEELEKEEEKLENTILKTDDHVVEKKKDREFLKDSKPKSDIESMLEVMKEDLEKQPTVTEFENEQEEKAIISYQELVDSIKNKSPKVEIVDDELESVVQNQVTEIRENTNEEIMEKSPLKEENQKSDSEEVLSANNIEDIELIDQSTKLEKSSNEIMEQLTKMEDKNIEQPIIKEELEEKHFKSTDFISPIYGKMNDHLKYPTVPSFEKKEEKSLDYDLYNDDYLTDFDFDHNMEVDSLEQTLNMPPISTEIKKNDEFLQALKEFRKNLD